MGASSAEQNTLIPRICESAEESLNLWLDKEREKIHLHHEHIEGITKRFHEWDSSASPEELFSLWMRQL